MSIFRAMGKGVALAIESHWELDDPTNEALVWDRIVGHSSEDQEETHHHVSVILEGIPIRGRVLEIGAGIGRLMKPLTGMTFQEIHGCDSSLTFVTLGQNYLGSGSQLVLNDGLTLPYPDSYFDFVFSFLVFQHFRSLAIIHRNLREIRRVLTTGGLCRIQTISSNGDDPRDLKTYDGRVFRSVDEFAQQFRDVGMEVVGTVEGLTHPKHIFVTARKVG